MFLENFYVNFPLFFLLWFLRFFCNFLRFFCLYLMNYFNKFYLRYRGGNRQQQPAPPTREALDAELDSYMAGTRNLLDRELDSYMADK